MSRLINLTNQEFGQLSVKKQVGTDKWGQALWECLCNACGQITNVRGYDLRNGEQVSCGCLQYTHSNITKPVHGQTRIIRANGSKKPSPEYYSWQGMKKRCLDSSHMWYKHYGGRGITICDRWVNSFQNFITDMGVRPPDCTLDRIDVNGNYEPANCRWSTFETQANNKRTKSNFQGITI